MCCTVLIVEFWEVILKVKLEKPPLYKKKSCNIRNKIYRGVFTGRHIVADRSRNGDLWTCAVGGGSGRREEEGSRDTASYCTAHSSGNAPLIYIS